MRDNGRQVLSYLPDGLRALIGGLVADVEWLKRKANERPAAPPPEPLIFHWSGSVADYIDDRNGPAAFSIPGVIYRIEYRFDTAGSVTVAWELDGVAMTGSPHAVTVETSEGLAEAYGGGNIVGTVTASDATASGLTALVFLR